MKKPTDLMKLLGADAAKVRPGRTLTVTLSVPGYNTRIDSWKVREHGKPARARQCVPLGWSAPQKVC